MKILDKAKLEKVIDTRAHDDLEQHKIMGLSLRVMQNGEKLLDRVYGERIDSHSLFRLASMTKPITAVAVMQLAERGKIDLQDPIEKYLPELADMPLMHIGENGDITKEKCNEKVRILQLLTHTSGICAGSLSDYFYSKMSAEDDKTLDSAIKYYSKTALGFVPYTANEYSPLIAFDILAKTVELVSGLDYNEYLTKNIFAPCGMTDTTFTPSAEQWARVVPMHARLENGNGVCDMPVGCAFKSTPTTHYLGGAGLISSLDDYSSFAQMLLNNGQVGSCSVLCPESVKLLSSAHVPERIMPAHERWGLGVRVIVKDGYYLPKHCFGWSGAYGTHFWVDPINNITAVYMRNSSYDGGAGAAAACTFEKDVYSALI